jgi:hypothetical protein
MNADHEEAVEFAKVSKRENRVYVGNLSYEVRYRDLMEFMRGGGWGNPDPFFFNCGDKKWLWLLFVAAVFVGEYPLGGRYTDALKSFSGFWPWRRASLFLFPGFLIDGTV